MKRIAITVSAFLATLLVGSLPHKAQANLLVDPSFENNPLQALPFIVADFVAHEGTWGVEALFATGSARVPTEGPISPPDGQWMLRLPGALGGVEIQAFQVTNLTNHASMIDSGSAVLEASALFNANVPAAVAGIRFWYFDTPDWDINNAGDTVNVTIDNDPATWETVSITANVPVGTRWLITDLFFNSASLGQGNFGYVDAATLSIVPEPSALALLAVTGLALPFVRKRKPACGT